MKLSKIDYAIIGIIILLLFFVFFQKKTENYTDYDIFNRNNNCSYHCDNKYTKMKDIQSCMNSCMQGGMPVATNFYYPANWFVPYNRPPFLAYPIPPIRRIGRRRRWWRW